MLFLDFIWWKVEAFTKMAKSWLGWLKSTVQCIVPWGNTVWNWLLWYKWPHVSRIQVSFFMSVPKRHITFMFLSCIQILSLNSWLHHGAGVLHTQLCVELTPYSRTAWCNLHLRSSHIPMECDLSSILYLHRTKPISYRPAKQLTHIFYLIRTTTLWDQPHHYPHRIDWVIVFRAVRRLTQRCTCSKGDTWVASPARAPNHPGVFPSFSKILLTRDRRQCDTFAATFRCIQMNISIPWLQLKNTFSLYYM